MTTFISCRGVLREHVIHIILTSLFIKEDFSQMVKNAETKKMKKKSILKEAENNLGTQCYKNFKNILSFKVL